MRNRDSAMKSRERKKMYVKDLETKSKYLEAECRRLSYALQCCAAENMALRQSLLKDRPVGAATAMQESAVLTGKTYRQHFLFHTSISTWMNKSFLADHFELLSMLTNLCLASIYSVWSHG